MNEERIKQTQSGMLFFDLLILMRELIRANLGLGPDDEGKLAKNIPAARHLIDIAGVLEEKTKGNLTEQENQVLQNLLTELRVACVRAETLEREAGEKQFKNS